MLTADNLLGYLCISRMYTLPFEHGKIKLVNRKLFFRGLNKQGVYTLVRNVPRQNRAEHKSLAVVEKQHTRLCQRAVPGYWSVHSELSNIFWEM